MAAKQQATKTTLTNNIVVRMIHRYWRGSNMHNENTAATIDNAKAFMKLPRNINVMCEEP